jgi:phosphoglycolate phosphatase (TIGR01487 family)
LIKFMAIDIDGTMTFRDRRLDVAAVEAVRRAEAASLPIVLATGNIACFTEAWAVMLGTSGFIIAEDGGVVLDRISGMEEVLGDRTEADRGLDALRREFGNLKQTRGSLTRLTGLTLERTITAEQAMDVFHREGLGLIAVDSGFAIHIKNPDINKGNALRKLASILKISMAEITAVGDGLNDIEMLKAAGVSFAVANSDELVKKTCTHVTSAPYGRGVAEAVEKVLALYR